MMSSPGFRPESIDGRRLSEAECDRLHFLKNKPELPTIDGMPIEFPPYQFRPYPSAMYGLWTDETKRVALRKIAGHYGLNLSEPREYDQAEQELPEYDSRLVHSDAERKDWAARGWADEPTGVQAAQTTMLEQIAEDAAVRSYDDLHMTDKSRAEFHAADQANGEDHLLDLAPPKKKPGRPAKPKEPAHV